jgi:hypothetical protein
VADAQKHELIRTLRLVNGNRCEKQLAWLAFLK